MVFKKIFVHLGFHKTGTTSFQQYCFNSNLNILELQVVKRDLISPHVYEFDLAKIKREIDRRLLDHDYLIISDEELSGNPHTNGNGGLMQRLILERLKLLAQFYDIELFCTIRQQTAIIESSYRQYIKKGGTQKLEDYLQLNCSNNTNYRKPGFSVFHFDYFNYANLCYKTFGEAPTFLVYEKHQNVVTALLENMNINKTDPDTEKRKNESFGKLQLQILRYFNYVLCEDDSLHRGLIKNRFLKKCLNVCLKIIPNSRNAGSFLREREKQILIDFYRQSNAALDNASNLGLKKFDYY